jgi:hypothetical protein
VLPWARRHIPEVLLILTGIAAGAVTVLSDVNETVPWGHEFGIGVSQLAFAYVGAYIFNWLIVERPRAQALRGYYRAAWPYLSNLSHNPTMLILRLQELADEKRRVVPDDQDVLGLTESVGMIPWARLDEERPRAMRVFSSLISKHRDSYESLIPILNNFDPSVAVSVSALNTLFNRRILPRLGDADWVHENMPDPVWHSALASHAFEYYAAGENLLTALRESSFTPWRESEETFMERLRDRLRSFGRRTRDDEDDEDDEGGD